MNKKIDLELAELLVYDAIYHKPGTLFSCDLTHSYNFGVPLAPHGHLYLILRRALYTLKSGGFINWTPQGGWVVCEPWAAEESEKEEVEIDKELAELLVYDAITTYPNKSLHGFLKDKYDFGVPLDGFHLPIIFQGALIRLEREGFIQWNADGWVACEPWAEKESEVDENDSVEESKTPEEVTKLVGEVYDPKVSNYLVVWKHDWASSGHCHKMYWGKTLSQVKNYLGDCRSPSQIFEVEVK